MNTLKNKQSFFVPFLDLKKNHDKIEDDILTAFKNVLKRGVFILGDEVKLFEKEFAEYLGTSYAIGVASGTDALLLAIKALDLKPTDEIIIPANAYPTAFAAALSGVQIRLVDVDYKTGTIDPQELIKTISSKTKAIIVVHLYGQAANMDAILKISNKHNISVIEDAAQAHGTEYMGKKVGTLGTIGCFSFYPTKNLGALGDGGMVVTKSKHLANKIRHLRMYGETSRYNSVVPGFNSRLDELQAAVLRIKLKTLDQDNRKRKQIAKFYIEKLQGTSVILPEYGDLEEHNFHIFAIKTKERKRLQDFLQKNGVETAIHYPIPIHHVATFKNLGYKAIDFPISVVLSQEILSLPCYPLLQLKKVEKICNLIRDALE